MRGNEEQEMKNFVKGFAVSAVVIALLQFGLIGETLSQPAKKAGDPEQAAPAKIPPVVLSKAHQALCKVKVGDTMPDVTAPQIGGGSPAKISSFYGDKATVVVFWNSDRRMAREQLADLGPEVIEPFGKSGVNVVGIAVGAQEDDAQAALNAAGADFTNWLDTDGKAFAQVGSEKLPRTYLLDPKGKVLWFDIEYSLGTRRELNQALRAVVGEPAPNK
jgi:peroxiredoxin